MPCCSSVNCKNRSEQGIRVFRFPSNVERRNKWVSNMRRANWQPTPTAMLCEAHFEDNQFESGRADGWRKLKPNAVPTLFDVSHPSPSRRMTKFKVRDECPASKSCRDEENTEPVAEKMKEENPDGMDLLCTEKKNPEKMVLQPQKEEKQDLLNTEEEIKEENSENVEIPPTKKQNSENVNMQPTEEEELKLPETVFIKQEIEDEPEEETEDMEEEEEQHEDIVQPPEAVYIKEEPHAAEPEADGDPVTTGSLHCEVEEDDDYEMYGDHQDDDDDDDDGDSYGEEDSRDWSGTSNDHQQENALKSGAERRGTGKELSNTDESQSEGSNDKRNPLDLTVRSNGKYCCTVCGKRFPSSSGYNRHMRIHTGVKAFKCGTCGKSFTESGNLHKHMAIHTGGKQYQCDICEKRFASRQYLTYHLQSHTGVKPYECDICQKRYFVRRILVKHRRLHSGERPFRCDVCGKSFAENGVLTKHLLVHSEEKPYKCNLCEKRFSRRDVLSKHILLHSGEKRFSCNVCGRRFAIRGNMARHMRVHNKKQGVDENLDDPEYNPDDSFGSSVHSEPVPGNPGYSGHSSLGDSSTPFSMFTESHSLIPAPFSKT